MENTMDNMNKTKRSMLAYITSINRSLFNVSFIFTKKSEKLKNFAWNLDNIFISLLNEGAP